MLNMRLSLQRLRTLLATVVAFAAAAHELPAQPRVSISDQPSCDTCAIQVSPLLLLRGRGISGLTRVAMDTRGDLYLGPTTRAGEVLQFDSRGRFVRRLGREQSASSLASVGALSYSPSEGLYVFDPVRGRFVLFSSAGAPVRAIGAHGLSVFTILPFGRRLLVVQGARATPSLVGYTLHVIDSTGARVRSMDEPQSTFRGGEFPDFRAVAMSGDRRLWIAAPNRYEIAEWTSDGRKLRTLVREPIWFRPWQRMSVPLTAPAQPAISSVHQDGQGRLWVAIRVPDPTWRAPAGPSRQAEIDATSVDLSTYLDTLIEVIDLRTGRVITRARDRGAPLHFLAEGVAYRHVRQTSGQMAIQIVRVRLTTKPGGTR